MDLNLSKLHTYLAKLGCKKILHPKLESKKLIGSKWNGMILATFQPKWQELSLLQRSQKEVAFCRMLAPLIIEEFKLNPTSLHYAFVAPYKSLGQYLTK